MPATADATATLLIGTQEGGLEYFSRCYDTRVVTTDDVLAALAAKGTSMLIVTHEMQFARDVSHKVMMFDHGQILEQGTPDAILSNPEHERTKRFLTSIL